MVVRSWQTGHRRRFVPSCTSTRSFPKKANASDTTEATCRQHM
jgi:hypothetical protein